TGRPCTFISTSPMPSVLPQAHVASQNNGNSVPTASVTPCLTMPRAQEWTKPVAMES
ncbi:hypothetical protein P7K49_003274, partial [Saguinus oedipus]